MAAGSTLTQNVYQRLRADLLACRLMPGQKLKIEELCERLSAGSSAVREALSRLAADGFVVVEPQRGFRVTPLSFTELRDLTNVRCEIEGQCIRDAIKHGDIDWETAVIAALHRLSRTPERAPDDPKRYNDDFAVAHTCISPSRRCRLRKPLAPSHSRAAVRPARTLSLAVEAAGANRARSKNRTLRHRRSRNRAPRRRGGRTDERAFAADRRHHPELAIVV